MQPRCTYKAYKTSQGPPSGGPKALWAHLVRVVAPEGHHYELFQWQDLNTRFGCLQNRTKQKSGIAPLGQTPT